MNRDQYVTPKEILYELDYTLRQGQKIDYITLSGSGEPTLNFNIGEIIKAVKGITGIPVAVLTNGTLFYQEQVREALYQADLVIPSLDAVSQDIFERVNRPHSSLKADRLIEGLISFRSEFCGEIWLEIMFVKGFNDHLDEVIKIKNTVSKINPQKIQINTVVRPPAEDCAKELSSEDLQKIKVILGEECSIIKEVHKKGRETSSTDVKSAIVNLTRRRAVTLSDILSLGIHRNEAIKCLRDLQKEKVIYKVVYDGHDYYRHMGRNQTGKV